MYCFQLGGHGAGRLVPSSGRRQPVGRGRPASLGHPAGCRPQAVEGRLAGGRQPLAGGGLCVGRSFLGTAALNGARLESDRAPAGATPAPGGRGRCRPGRLGLPHNGRLAQGLAATCWAAHVRNPLAS